MLAVGPVDPIGRRVRSLLGRRALLSSNLGALANLDFSGAELAAIDKYATDADINIWRASSDL